MGIKGITSVHHQSTYKGNAQQWRITELTSDIENLSLYEAVAGRKSKPGFTLLISLCYEAIDAIKATNTKEIHQEVIHHGEPNLIR